jgi:hypothetical protein
MSRSRNLATLFLMMTIGAAACAQSTEPIGSSSSAVEVGAERDVDPPVLVRAPVSFIGEDYAFKNVLTGLAYDVQNDTYVAVWSDGREDFPSFEQYSQATYGARISSAGVVLDPAGFRIAGPVILPGTLQGAFVSDVACSDNGICLVVGDRASSQAGPDATLAVRIADDQLLDDEPFVIAQSTNDARVVWDGTAFRVALQGSNEDTRFYTARIGVDGQVEAPIAMTPLHRSGGEVACEGARCLLVYRDNDSQALLARVVDLAAPVSDEVQLPSTWSRYEGKPCWDGTRYWLSYIDEAATVRAVRVGADGTVVDPIGIEVATVSGHVDPLYRTGIALACADDHVLVTWSTPIAFDPDSPHRAWVARVALDGTVLDPGGVEIAATQFVTGSGAQIGSPIACGAGQCLVAWRHEREWAGTARATRIVDATELDPEGIDVITSPAAQIGAAAAHAGDRTFAVWNDSRPASADSGDRPLRGSILDPGLDSLASVELGQEPTCPGFGIGDREPAVAASGTSFLAAWHGACRNGDIHAQVIDPQGQAVAPTFKLSSGQPKERQPAAASDGAGFFAAWNSGASIRARLLDADGTLLGPDSFEVAARGASAVAAFDGANYVLVYQLASNLHAARVSTDGDVLDPQGIPIATESAREQEQSMACGGGECLIAWRRGTATGTMSRILATRLAPDGTVLDPGGFEVSPANLHGGTAVAFTGHSFIVTWRQGEGEIRGSEIALDGTPIGTAGFLVSPSGEIADRPVLVANGTDQVAALYDRFDDTPAYRVRRVRVRAIAAPESVSDPGR